MYFISFFILLSHMHVRFIYISLCEHMIYLLLGESCSIQWNCNLVVYTSTSTPLGAYTRSNLQSRVTVRHHITTDLLIFWRQTKLLKLQPPGVCNDVRRWHDGGQLSRQLQNPTYDITWLIPKDMWDKKKWNDDEVTGAPFNKDRIRL